MNQPPPLAGYDLFAANRPLVEALEREEGGYGREEAEALGQALGGEQLEEGRARYLVERLALALQASLLLRHGEPAAAAAFCATRLAGEGGRAFGTLPRGLDPETIVARHTPLAAVT